MANLKCWAFFSLGFLTRGYASFVFSVCELPTGPGTLSGASWGPQRKAFLQTMWAALCRHGGLEAPTARWDTRLPQGPGPRSAPPLGTQRTPPPNPQGCREWEGSLVHPYLAPRGESLMSHPTMGAPGLGFSPSLNEALKPVPGGPGAPCALCRGGTCRASRGSRILAGAPHRASGSMMLLTMGFVTDILPSCGS